MKYRDLLKLYKQGKLQEQQAQTVEEDIEKHKAISEYIVEELEQEDWEMGDVRLQAREVRPSQAEVESNAQERKVSQPSDKKDKLPLTGKGISDKAASLSEEKSEDFVREINREIHRAFVKMGVTVTTILLCVVLFCMFALSPLTKLFYYNPAKETAYVDKDGEEDLYYGYNQMSLDWSVYSELSKPGKIRSSVNVTDLGYGKYSFLIGQSISYTNTFHNVSGMVDRGEVQLYDTSILNGYFPNYFAYAQLNPDKSVTQQENADSYIWYGNSREDARKELEKLDDEAYYTGYISFDRLLSFDEMKELVDKYQCTPVWCGIRTDYNDDMGEGEPISLYLEPVGFSMETTGSALAGWDEEKYPNLNIWTKEEMQRLNPGESRGTGEVTKRDASWYKTHLTSMLQYTLDNPALMDTFDLTEEQCAKWLDTVESHDMKFYGMVVVAPKEELLQIWDDKDVYGIIAQESY